jgi:hypothetical protein
VQTQPPFEQFANEHFAPASHWSVQPPPEQSTLHVEPAAHAVRHAPSEHETLHVAPFGQDVLQCPFEQSTWQRPAPQYVTQ